ncbi:LysR family transcriptional regulator [Oxalobacteraceae bacterium CAVE-383]|nr:LysR family transcriptional regulator [Oxalobacteraceae bacterium CAVE-383]
MDIKWIEDFLSLAQTRNFSRSAENRAVTQPAFSRRIRALEAWVGADLIDRSTYPLTLTPAGKLFSDSARDAMRLLDDSRSLLRGQRADANMLRIAAGHTLSLNFFPLWIESIRARHGEIRARILPTNVHDSVLSLVEGNCDLLLCYHHPELPVELDPARYGHVCLGAEVVMPMSIPDRGGNPMFALPGSKRAPTPALSFTGGSFFGQVVNLIRSKAKQASHLSAVHESDLAELLKTMALAGHGLAWLPESSIARERADGKLVRAGGDEWTVKLEIRLFRAYANTNPGLNALWDFLLKNQAAAVPAS